MYIKRLIKQEIKERLLSKKIKIIVLYGARQVGKTSLIENVLKDFEQKTLRLSGDEEKTEQVFSSRNLEKMMNMVSGYEILFIDEAQRIKNIGLNLKLLHDGHPRLKIIVTGSSSFELASSIQEPLTGRTWNYHLYPVAMCELASHWTPYELKKKMESFLVFGTYPEVFSLERESDRCEYVSSLTTNYLYKDILEMEGIKKSSKIKRLLQLLAFQIGNEVSFTELGQQLEMNKKTVERYIDLLEKFFIVFSLTGFNRNLRKEVSRKPKIYFCDLGLRNAIINNFNALENRNDNGVLWENFIISERIKYNAYYKRFVSSYFWRVYTGAELDYVEESQGRLHGYEVKWRKSSKIPVAWAENYKADFDVINKENFLKFISK